MRDALLCPRVQPEAAEVWQACKPTNSTVLLGSCLSPVTAAEVSLLAYFVVHAFRSHTLVVGQSSDLSAFRGFHSAAAEGHFLKAVRLHQVRTIGQP